MRWTIRWQILICITDNITNILHIWSSEIRSNKNREYITAKNQLVDLSQERGLDRFLREDLGVSPDRVVEGVAIRVPRVVIEGRSQDPDRDHADQDHDHADRDHNRVNQSRDRVDRSLGLEIALDRAVAENRQVDLARKGKRSQDLTLRRGTRVTNCAVDPSQVPKRVTLGPDEIHGLEVVPSLAAEIVTGVSVARGRLLSSKLHERNHDPHHPDEDHAVVLGLCQSHQVVEVAPGQELPPQIILTSKTWARNLKNLFKKKQQKQRKCKAQKRLRINLALDFVKTCQEEIKYTDIQEIIILLVHLLQQCEYLKSL